MVWVERDAQGNIKGQYSIRQPGYAEEELPDDDPSLPPPPSFEPVKRRVPEGIVRATVTAGVLTTTTDSIGFSSVTRVSAGRYRCSFSPADTGLALICYPTVRDAADVRWRTTAQTAMFVELRTVNAAGSPVDVAGFTMTTEKVTT